jgi:FixJ family two-component response regulator
LSGRSATARLLRVSAEKKYQMPRDVLISIVDDEADVREAMENLLKSFGFLTVSYSSARELLNSDRLVDTGCLISDVDMAEMDGAELFLKLKDLGHGFPVIFVTGSSHDESIVGRLLAAGAQAVLSKPCSPQALINCLALALKL